MKILRLLIWNTILLICIQLFGQNVKNQIKLTASQQLFKNLSKKENYSIITINGFYNENNDLYLSRIKSDDIEKIEILDNNTAISLYGNIAINGCSNVILKIKKLTVIRDYKNFIALTSNMKMKFYFQELFMTFKVNQYPMLLFQI